MDWETPVRNIKGVGEKIEKLLNKLGISTAGELISYFPRAYRDFTQIRQIKDITAGEEAAISVSVEGTPKLNRIRRNLSIFKFVVSDGTSQLTVVYYNQPYMQQHIKAGDKLFLLGKLQVNRFESHMDNPMMVRGDTPGILPVYGLTAGLNQKKLRLIMEEGLKACIGGVKEIFSESFRREHRLCTAAFAYQHIHFPQDVLSREEAKRRLVFEEMLLFSAMLKILGGNGDGEAGLPFACDDGVIDAFMRLLPFTPTHAQLRVMREMLSDYKSGKAQNRLVQGDVGCGKTMLAYFAMYVCAKSGYQCAMMAPTELLARQHFEGAFRLMKDEGINIELITGSHTAAQKKQTVKKFTSGQAHILFGTHALIYESVEFFNLGLVVTDEQHRFGVRQRAALKQKGEKPHMLIMSATPIPRTLALILYGKTDISVVDELPPGREPVKTHIVPEAKRKGMYEFIKKETDAGGQAFVVCPLIEKNEDVDARSAEEIFEEVKGVFGKESIALLHGRMRPAEKESVIEGFRRGDIRLLVSTTVIEVGVNIPAATVMVIENAERFGLAQLHQLRGRVGRGSRESYCFLTTQGQENERLTILTQSSDGFEIAQKDLLLRGPGEFLGARQNGVGDLYMAHLIRDVNIIKEAQNIYEQLTQKGQTDELRMIQDAALEKFSRRFEEISMN
jgi:ATP-dependent DNA helicase RecG